MNKEELICTLMDESNDDWNLEEYKQFMFETITKADGWCGNVFEMLMDYCQRKKLFFAIGVDKYNPMYLTISIYTLTEEVAYLRINSIAVHMAGDETIMNEIEAKIMKWEEQHG